MAADRRAYRMTDEQHDRLMAASRPVPYLVIGGVEPMSPQQNANNAWRALADEMGFVWDTVAAAGPDTHEFTAIAAAESGAS